MDPAARASIEQTFRLELGRAVATLVRLVGDIDVAEEADQDAFVIALGHWPTFGVPPNPGGWIVTTARNGQSTASGGRPRATTATLKPSVVSRRPSLRRWDPWMTSASD